MYVTQKLQRVHVGHISYVAGIHNDFPVIANLDNL